MKKSNKIKYIHRGSTKKTGSAGKVGLKTFIYARDSDITANEEIFYFFPPRRTHWTLYINYKHFDFYESPPLSLSTNTSIQGENKCVRF